METEHVAVEQPRAEESDLLGTFVAYVVSVLSPMVGIAIGAVLRLTGVGQARRTGTHCMIIGGIMFVLQIAFFFLMWLVVWLIAFGIMSAVGAKWR